MVDIIIAYLKSNREEIIDGINKKVNLPLISEAKEEKIFASLFDAFMEVLESVLNKKGK
jgi:hypothetical protein|tara:strand:+ start:1326 stop:1502 length:177 start_codon:yes stop_codon:yes gene_type:complete